VNQFRVITSEWFVGFSQPQMSIVGAPTGPARRGGTRVTSSFTLLPCGLSRFSGTTSWPHVASDATELTSGGHVIVVYFGVYVFACAPVGVGCPSRHPYYGASRRAP
jgi:hypothetical protein